MLARLVSSKWAWDWVLGPFYNRTIERAASGVYQDVIRRLSICDGLDILDVGCGPAFVTLQLAAQHSGARFTGLDYSRTEIQFATRRACQRGLTIVEFQLGDAMELPWTDGVFDLAFSIASLKYWPSGVHGLAEIRRVLRPGGSALIVEGDREATTDAIDAFAAGHVPWQAWRRLMERGFRRMAYPQAQATACAVQAGFDTVNVQKMERWPFVVMTLRKASGTQHVTRDQSH